MQAPAAPHDGDGATLKRPWIVLLLKPSTLRERNAVAERTVGSFRRECFEYAIIVNGDHQHTLLEGVTAYDNQQRPYRTSRLAPPVPTACTPHGHDQLVVGAREPPPSLRRCRLPGAATLQSQNANQPTSAPA